MAGTTWALLCGTAVILALVWVAAAWKHRGPDDSLPIALLRSVTLLYARLFHRLRVKGPGKDPIPAHGAFIVVANHRSGVDPVLMSVVTRRRLRFLMAREYYEVPVLHHMFRALGCIPVNRDGNDLAATKTTIRALRDGQVIGVFPQGAIRAPNAPLEGKSGIALFALRTGAPIIPVHIEGTPSTGSVFAALFIPSRTTIRVGSPLVMEKGIEGRASREDIEQLTARILAAISELGATAQPGEGTARDGP